MRRIFNRLNQQRGQVLIMFIGIFTVVTIFGVMVVDFGIWFSERRGAQTDADLPALAGARECMLQLATGEFGSHDPYPAIVQWFSDNNDNGSGDSELVADGTSTECFDPSDAGPCGADSAFCCVDVTVRDTTSTTFFSSLFSPIFDHVAGNMGAHARACAGAANNPGGYLPVFSATNGPCFMTDEQTPNLGGICPIKFDSSGTPETGLLDLLRSGACSQWSGPSTIKDNMEGGIGGMCLISDTPDGGAQSCDPADGGGVRDGAWYECVAAKGGNNAGPALTGLNNRLTKASDCGSDFSDVVTEVAPGVYEAKDCDSGQPDVQPSPRLVTIFILKEAPNTGGGDKGQPINAFAGFFIEGCAPDSIGAEVGGQCANNDDDDDDDKVNDGCPKHGDPEQGSDCNNDSDDDGDGEINDGCPAVVVPSDLNLTPQQKVCGTGGPGQQLLYGRFLKLTMAGSGIGPVDPSSTEFGIALVDWEGGGSGTPGPTSVPTPGSPTSTPVPPTVAPTSPPPPTPTPCPCGVKGNGECKPCH